MSKARREIAAVYGDRSDAEAARQHLTSGGYPADKIVLLQPHDLHADTAVEPDPDGVRREVVHDIYGGAGAGAAVGAAASVGGYLATEAALFVAAPILAPLLAVGYAAAVGGAVGAARGLHVKQDLLAGLVREALEHDHHVMLVYADDEDEEEQALAMVRETTVERESHT